MSYSQETILLKVKEIKSHETKKGSANYNIIYKKLKNELAAMMPDVKILDIGNYVIEAQYNPKLKRKVFAIYPKSHWNNKMDFIDIQKGLYQPSPANWREIALEKERKMREASAELETKYQNED
jgi:hypothetical protein